MAETVQDNLDGRKLSKNPVSVIIPNCRKLIRNAILVDAIQPPSMDFDNQKSTLICTSIFDGLLESELCAFFDYLTISDYLWCSFYLLLSSIIWLTSPAEIISIMTRTTHSWLLLMPSPPSSSILMFLPSIISIFPLLHHFDFNYFFIFQCRKNPLFWWFF